MKHFFSPYEGGTNLLSESYQYNHLEQVKSLCFITIGLNKPHKLSVSVAYSPIWKGSWILISVFYRCCYETVFYFVFLLYRN